jgi:hypothetical protein
MSPKSPKKAKHPPKRLGDHTGAATLKVAGVRLLISNCPIAESRYQHGTLQGHKRLEFCSEMRFNAVI